MNLNIPQHELNRVLNDGFYVKINKGWTATVRCLKDFIDALNSGDHEIDMGVFGVITKESTDENQGNFLYYLLEIIGKYRGMAVNHNQKHTFIELEDDRHTISIKTSKGKLVTFAVMDYADCIDVVVHNSGHEPVQNGEEVPQFEIMGLNCGSTPVKSTKVTVAVIKTK